MVEVTVLKGHVIKAEESEDFSKKRGLTSMNWRQEVKYRENWKAPSVRRQ